MDPSLQVLAYLAEILTSCLRRALVRMTLAEAKEDSRQECLPYKKVIFYLCLSVFITIKYKRRDLISPARYLSN